MKYIVEKYLSSYLAGRPLFLSLIRAKELELFERFMKVKHPVLDVGCGDGFFANTFIKCHVSSVMRHDNNKIDVGLDLRGSRLEEARKFNIYKKLVYYDGKKIPFPNNIFQTIVSNCVLEHVADLHAVLQEMYRVLKPQGRAYVAVMGKPWEENLFGSMIFGHAYVSYMRQKQQHVNLFSDKKWASAFSNAGFTVEKCIGYLSPKACRFIDFAHYLSIPSLISYVLFRRWVLFPELTGLYPVFYLSRLIASDVAPSKAGALFFVLRRDDKPERKKR